MSDDQPTRDLGQPEDDTPATAELSRGRRPPPDHTRIIPDDFVPLPPPSERETRVIRDDEFTRRPGSGAADQETRVLPDDLIRRPSPGPRVERDPVGGAGPSDTQPIDVGGRRQAWRRRRQPPQRPAWDEPPRDYERPPPGWERPRARSRLRRSLPPAGRWAESSELPPPPGSPWSRRSQHLLVWAFTIAIAIGLGATLVLGVLDARLDLSGQASAILVGVASVLIWVLLSPLLRLAGILAVLVTPLFYAAGSIPELRRLPFDLPQPDGALTLLIVSLGITAWLVGHWFFYARKGWWKSRLASITLGTIPGVEASHRPPD